MKRVLGCVLGALLFSGAAGCTWETGDEPVYYNEIQAQQKQHLAQDPNEDPNQPAPSTEVNAGTTPAPTGTAPGNPEPSPWKTSKGTLQGGTPSGQTTTTSAARLR